MENEVRRSTTVPASRQRAFSVFTERLGEWWPQQLTFFADRFKTAEIEPEVGGEWFEIDTRGQAMAWGDVRAWEPPARIVVSWRVSAERQQEPVDRASEVEVVFREAGDSHTEVVVAHRNFDRHQEGAEKMRYGMASEHGWSKILETYANAVSD